MRVMDLGCGKGLTSIYLAEKYGVTVTAVDLWISAADNYRRFKEMGVDHLVTPIQAEAHALSFADAYFDAVISVDAYHYFGNNKEYFDKFLRPMLKDDALVALAFPEMKYELHEAVPEEMKPFWNPEELAMWHSIDWWKDNLEGKLAGLDIHEMQCFESAWNEWLATDNPYAVNDRDMINKDNGRFMNLISLTGRVTSQKC